MSRRLTGLTICAAFIVSPLKLEASQQTGRSPDPDRRTVSLNNAERNAARQDLPSIQTFDGRRSDQFIVDLESVRTGHPYKGKDAEQPHSGGHVYFEVPNELSLKTTDEYPAIYAATDGVISRIDYSFRLREMYEPALGRRVANTRYGIGLMFATEDDIPIELHYSIEPFVDPGDEYFYDRFILVEPGQHVQQGDVIARMYLPPNRQLAQKSHIHFNLIGGEHHRFMAPVIFSDDIVRSFHTTWGRFGMDGDTEIPPCMGYRLAPEENPFRTGEKESL